MKKAISILMLLAMMPALFAGCQKEKKPVSCAEVIAAYEEAGYDVYHREYPEKEYGYVCEVTIEEEDGDSICFHFHETNEEAEAEAEERQWNGLLWMFSAIYGDPTWLETETYLNIEIEYDDEGLYEPFKKLTK